MLWCCSLEKYALQSGDYQIDLDKTQFGINKLRIQVNEPWFCDENSDKRGSLPLLNRRNRLIQGSHL